MVNKFHDGDVALTIDIFEIFFFSKKITFISFISELQIILFYNILIFTRTERRIEKLCYLFFNQILTNIDYHRSFFRNKNKNKDFTEKQFSFSRKQRKFLRWQAPDCYEGNVTRDIDSS